MPSQLRINIINALSTRLTTLGHVLTTTELEMVANDVETQIAADASAQTDAQADVGSWPDPPQEQGG